MIVEKTTQEKPLHATHWSTRSLARELGTTQTMVHRVWQANGLKPHLVRNFKLSNDPRFEEKLKDVVGLYLDPPENALVFSADEKSQCQALDHVEPRAAGGREVHVETGMAREPTLHLWMLVRGVVVGDHVKLELRRRALVDQLQESDPFLVPVSLHAGCDHAALGHFDRGK